MKKILILTLITFALSGCAPNDTATETGATTVSELSTEEPTTTENANYIDEENIKEVNENSYMGIELNQSSGLSDEEANKYVGDQPYIIYPEQGDSKYYCYRYPNNDFLHTVTQISIEDKEYNVFGVSIGCDVDSAIEIIGKKGYEKEDYGIEGVYWYSKGDVQIIFHCEETTIERIVVSLKIEREEGVVY